MNDELIVNERGKKVKRVGSLDHTGRESELGSRSVKYDQNQTN